MQDKGTKLISRFFLYTPYFSNCPKSVYIISIFREKSVIKKSDFKLELETKMNTVW